MRRALLAALALLGAVPAFAQAPATRYPERPVVMVMPYTPGAADVLIRAMLPSTVDNLRITLGWCWTYLLIAEIVEVERFEQQASEHVQRLADDLAHLVSSRGMLVVRPVL